MVEFEKKFASKNLSQLTRHKILLILYRDAKNTGNSQVTILKKKTFCYKKVSFKMFFLSLPPEQWLNCVEIQPINELRYIDVGLGGQSLRLEFNTDCSSYTFVTRNQDKTLQFVEVLHSELIVMWGWICLWINWKMQVLKYLISDFWLNQRFQSEIFSSFRSH